MTRFIWWTAVWFGLGIIESAVMLHYAGWDGYHARYPDGVLALAALVHLALWILSWALIIRYERD